MRSPCIFLAASSLSLLASACTTTPVAPPIPVEPIAGSCDARDVSWAVGERATPRLLERVTLDSGARTARVIEPGEIVTMEFSPDRLTIDVDGRNRVVDLRCG